MPPVKSTRKRTRLTQVGERLQVFVPPPVAEVIRVDAARRHEPIGDNVARRLTESVGMDFDALVDAFVAAGA